MGMCLSLQGRPSSALRDFVPSVEQVERSQPYLTVYVPELTSASARVVFDRRRLEPAPQVVEPVEEAPAPRPVAPPPPPPSPFPPEPEPEPEPTATETPPTSQVDQLLMIFEQKVGEQSVTLPFVLPYENNVNPPIPGQRVRTRYQIDP